MTGKVVQPHALDHDRMMSEKSGMEVSPAGKLERRIVANLCEFLKDRGFDICSVYGGDVLTKCDTTKCAMETIFSLDEATLRFRKTGFPEHAVLLLMGNGIDIIGDWSYADNDPDGFDAAMLEFNPENYASSSDLI